MKKLKTNPTLYGEHACNEPVEFIESIYGEQVESIATIFKLAIYHEQTCTEQRRSSRMKALHVLTNELLK